MDGMQNPTYFFGGELVRPPPEGFPVLEGQPPERPPPLEPPPPLELLLIINFLTKCEKNPPPLRQQLFCEIEKLGHKMESVVVKTSPLKVILQRSNQENSISPT